MSCGAPAFAAASASVVAAAAAAAQFLIHVNGASARADKGMKEIDSFCNAAAAFSINAWNNARCRFWSLRTLSKNAPNECAPRALFYLSLMGLHVWGETAGIYCSSSFSVEMGSGRITALGTLAAPP